VNNDDDSETVARHGTMAMMAVHLKYSCMGYDFLTVNRKNINYHDSKKQHSVREDRWKEVKMQSFSQQHYARYSWSE
jgi:hypothetical protein